jgi:hypothetical protein
MRHLAVLFLFVLGVSAVLAVAESGAKTQVCVAKLDNNGSVVSPTVVRDDLIKFLDKTKNSQAEGVPVDTSIPGEALKAAKEKNCEYVVTTNVTEEHSDTGYTGGLAGVNMQTFYVTVEFHVLKVSDGTEVTKGAAKASDRGSAQNAIIATTKKIAEKVNDSIKK